MAVFLKIDKGWEWREGRRDCSRSTKKDLLVLPSNAVVYTHALDVFNRAES